jgi:hypothetical protein
MKILQIKTIKKIENNSKRYDIQTESNNFFANSILVHNSLINVYWDIYNNCWQVSTRKMAFAEGTTVLGNTFRQVFDKAIQNTNVMKFLNNTADKKITYIFELVSPETRIVTPYPDYKVYLIGARDNIGELYGCDLNIIAKLMNVERPKRYSFNSLEEAIKIAQTLNCMQEGFVLVYENGHSFWRLKCKNEKYLAIAHMRSNGPIAPKRILKLIMANDYIEYINYFPEDSKYVNFVKEIYEESINRIKNIYESNKNIENQKDFALTIIPLAKYSYEQGVIFGLRKGKELNECLNKIGEKNIAESLNLKEKMRDKFSLTFDDDV